MKKIIRFLMVIIFFVIGVALIAFGSYVIAKKGYGDYKWVYICDIVFGCLLLTSPYFLKKKE